MHISADIAKPHVLAFCAKVAPGGTLVEVITQPQLGKPINECFPIVDEHVTAFGGRRVDGWAIWELPGVFIEAEFHAVWGSPTKDLVDLVPRTWLCRKISFVPATHLAYAGKSIDNVRHALVKDPDVARFLVLSQQRFELLNRGERAYQLEVSLPSKDLKLLDAIDREHNRLGTRIQKRYSRNFDET